MGKVMRRKQVGFSLVELMVGLLVSMIGILGGVMLYQNLVRLSVESRTDAAHDGQLASAMLQLQLELQSAGFGIADAGLSHLASPDNSHLYWRYMDAGGTVCRGFDTEAVGAGLRLRLLEANCNATESLTGLTWTQASELALFVQNPPEVVVNVSASDCYPFGLGEADSHYMVTLTAQSSVRRGMDGDGDGVVEENNAVGLNNYNYCLPNIRQGGV